MILPMAKMRLLGARSRLAETLDALLDLGLVHLADLDHTAAGLTPVELTAIERRHGRYLSAAVADVDRALTALPPPAEATRPDEPRPHAIDWRRCVRSARRTRRAAEALAARRQALDAERARLTRFVRFADAFDALLPPGATRQTTEACPLVLAAGDVSTLERRLADVFGTEFELRSVPLDTGELAVAVLVAPGRAAEIDTLLRDAGIVELRLPSEYTGASLRDALPAMARRIAIIDGDLADIARQLDDLAHRRRATLLDTKRACVDRLRRLDAATRAAGTTRLFVLEGWVPERFTPRVEAALARRLGSAVVVERRAVEDWAGADVPVVFDNPPLFRPFEVITRRVPLPRYGTIDPTPFVGVFFPMFFGLVLGDVGYGLVLLTIAVVLRWRSTAGTTWRAIAQIALACSVFTILFGLAFGEFLGDLGHRALGMRPLVFARDQALVPFLGLTLALGFVHVLLGLLLGFVGGLRGNRRRSVGRGLAILMVALIGVAVLVALRLLPEALFTPLVVAILIAFPILVVLEGIIAPIELLSTFSHVLSYARIMALGTASVMMAVVANRLAGAMGSIVVGTLFALLFHLVNFVLGVFAPTIHGLRLHYVEFFGTFVSPGGVRYEPLRRWAPGEASTA